MSKRRLSHKWNQRYADFYEKRVKPFIVKPQFGDGCSFSPDGFVTDKGYVSIVKCCSRHDFTYSGDDDPEITREVADAELRHCIRCTLRAAGCSAFYSARKAWVYFRVVRAVGWAFYKGNDA